MARYIDANKLEKDFPQSVSKHNVIINGNEYPVFLVDHVLHKIRNYPAADVVPKSEVDKLESTLQGVMWSVDKWLDEADYNVDPIKRAITMREKTLQIVEKAKTEVAREIFMDIDRVVEKYSMGDIEYPAFVYIIAELKKKYTEDKNENT